MTFVVDNGEKYSDHIIFFIEGPPEFRNWLESDFVNWAKKNDTHYAGFHILIESEKVEWRNPKKRMTSVDFFDWVNKYTSYCDDGISYNPLPMLPDACINWKG